MLFSMITKHLNPKNAGFYIKSNQEMSVAEKHSYLLLDKQIPVFFHGDSSQN